MLFLFNVSNLVDGILGNRMEGRVVIVTGAGRGIGREVAHWMADDGASVVVNDLGGAVDGEGTSDSPAEQTAQEIRDKGGNAVANFDSVADYESAGKIIQTAIDNFGRIDAVCHVAGILRDRMVFNMTEEDEKRDAENKESQATKKARKHALAFYLNHGLSLNLMTKHYSAKSVR